jgi:hypothetical protein
MRLRISPDERQESPIFQNDDWLTEMDMSAGAISEPGSVVHPPFVEKQKVGKSPLHDLGDRRIYFWDRIMRGQCFVVEG